MPHETLPAERSTRPRSDVPALLQDSSLAWTFRPCMHRAAMALPMGLLSATATRTITEEPTIIRTASRHGRGRKACPPLVAQGRQDAGPRLADANYRDQLPKLAIAWSLRDLFSSPIIGYHGQMPRRVPRCTPLAMTSPTHRDHPAPAPAPARQSISPISCTYQDGLEHQTQTQEFREVVQICHAISTNIKRILHSAKPGSWLREAMTNMVAGAPPSS